MVSPADLKWTALPERPGMQFAVLTGDPKTGAYTQMRKVPGGTDNPLHAHSSDAQERRDQRRLVHRSGCGVREGFRPRVDRDDARRLGARERLPAGSDCVFYQDGKGRFDFKPAAKAP